MEWFDGLKLKTAFRVFEFAKRETADCHDVVTGMIDNIEDTMVLGIFLNVSKILAETVYFINYVDETKLKDFTLVC